MNAATGQLHDGRENLKAVEADGRWFVVMTCTCHRNRRVTEPRASEAAALRSIEALDAVARLRLAPAVRIPGNHHGAKPASQCVRGDLRRRRVALGLPVATVARALGCTSSAVGNIELYGAVYGPRSMRRLEAFLAAEEAKR